MLLLTLNHPIALSVDGNWGEWSKWSTCTKTCKQGKQSRKRECNSPAPQYGGKKCQGYLREHQACNENVPCPGIWSSNLCFFFSACQLHNMHNAETDDVYFMSTTVVNGVHHVTSYERLRCFKIVFFSELSPRLCRILQDLWYIFFQLTENGENGVSGVLVQKLVNRENNRGKENVTHQLHSMAARNVMDSLLKHKLVTRKSHAPVSLYLLNYMVQLVYSLKPRKRKT